MKRIDMTGQVFGSQYVEGPAGVDKHGQALWLTACECGTRRAVQGAKLRNGESTSCGCRKGARISAVLTRHGHSVGGHCTPEYRTWSNMIDRCERTGNAQFKDWGGRGIAVCERWRSSFENFLSDMGARPSPEHSIDRVNNDGDYEPGNCRWATRLEQAANKRPVHCSTCGGTGHNRRRCASVAA